VVYSEGDSNAWNTPLMDLTTDTIKNSSSKDYSKESIDLTKEDADNSASTKTISQLSQDLDFSRKNFNDSIQLTNKKRNEENTSFLNKISKLQQSTDTSIYSLTTLITRALTTQDKVITSLKTGQESMDLRMAAVTDNIKRQMNTMNQSLMNLQQTMLRLAGVPEADINHNQCDMSINAQDNSLFGT